jgi:hypothetical protein
MAADRQYAFCGHVMVKKISNLLLDYTTWLYKYYSNTMDALIKWLGVRVWKVLVRVRVENPRVTPANY